MVAYSRTHLITHFEIRSDTACSRLDIALTLAEISRLAQIRIFASVRQACYHTGTESTAAEIHGGCVVPFVVVCVVALDVRDGARSCGNKFCV